MTDRTRIFVLTLIMITVCLISSGFAITILYHTHIAQTKERLTVTAQSQARLIEAVARFDTTESADYPGGALAATLSQILDAHEHYSGFGETGEFTLARRDGDNIRFQFTHGHSVVERPEAIPFDSQLGEPMRRALKGLSGTLVGLDYGGEKVVAAYEPVAVLELGIVAKIDLKEVRAPFVTAGFAAAGITLAMVLVSTSLFSRISNPILRQIKAYSRDLQRQLEEREHLARFPAEDRSPVLRVSREGLLLYANPASEELLRDWGCQVEEPVPEYWKKVSQDALEENAEQRIEYNLADRTLSFVIAPVAGSGYVNLYGRDITERKKGEEEIKQAKECYDRLTDNAGEAIFRVKATGGEVIYVNAAAERIFGYSQEEWLADRSLGFNIIHPEYRDRQQEIVEEIVAGKETIKDVVLGWIAKDGRKVIMEYTIIPVCGKDGEVLYFESIGRDITERKRAEEELRLDGEVMKNMAEGVYLVGGEDGIIIWANPKFEKMFGYEPGEMNGQHASIVIAPIEKDAREIIREIREVLNTTGKWNGDINNIKKNGMSFWCYANCSMFNHPEYGRVVVAVHTDITERKRAEEESFNAQQRLIDQQRHETEHVESELARVRQELVRSTRLAAIGQVSASIAHDLRNPLGAVRNAAYLLNRRLPKDESKLLDYTDIINQEVAKADQIITNLLEMVGAKVPRKHPVDLAQILEEVEQDRKSEGVACRISVVPDPFVVQADEGQLRQVIDNILSNSLYAMGGQGSFFVEASRDSDYDTIVLRDTGPGFVPEVRERLFEALVTTKASGIGLGLTICQQIIEKHGGTIEADEHNQRGAVIRIRLPRG